MVTRTGNHSQMTGDTFWEVRIPSRISECRRVVDEFIARTQELGVASEKTFALRTGLHEAVVNAVRHGNRQDPEKSVRVACHFIGNDVWFEVEDQGVGFDVTRVVDPCIRENRNRAGGRGLLLMRHFMSSVEYNEQGNCVRMVRTGARN